MAGAGRAGLRAAPGCAGARSGPTTVLYCHGNGETMANRVTDLARLHDAGLATLIFDYRGYGRSDGAPSERATYEDAAAAHAFLVEGRGLAPREILAFLSAEGSAGSSG